MPAPDANTLVSGLLGAIAGFATSFGLFRARFTSVEKDISALQRELGKEVTELKNDLEKEIKRIHDDNMREWSRMREEVQRLCSGDQKYWEGAQRRQMVQLELIGAVARKLGVASRFSDVSSYIEPTVEPDKPK